MKRYTDSQFRAAREAGARTTAEVAAHVGCSVSTARRRGLLPDSRKKVDDLGEARAKLARIASHIRVAVRLMEWADGDEYVSACWTRGKNNPLRRSVA